MLVINTETMETIKEINIGNNWIESSLLVGDHHVVLHTGAEKKLMLFDTRTYEITDRKDSERVCCMAMIGEDTRNFIVGKDNGTV